MKANILKQLSLSAEPVSGEHLSRILGVSRVAVWKHIQKLQALGYAIDTSPKGYRLLSGPDTPFSWVFGKRADRVHYFPELGSTMDKAMAMARQGCPANTVVVADIQTKGRGRLQRAWQSMHGGLYFTMVLRPAIPPTKSPLINLAAAVDMTETLRELYDIQAQVKWPNDIQVDGRKVAGILSQMASDADCIEFVNLGIGLNVHNETDMVDQAADAIARLTPKAVSRADILSSFMERIERRMDKGKLDGVVAEWKQYAITLGREVKVQTLTDIYQGRAVDVDKGGGLILEESDGQLRTVVYGDCFHNA